LHYIVTHEGALARVSCGWRSVKELDLCYIKNAVWCYLICDNLSATKL